MKIGIIGLAGAGKKTIFAALTGNTNGHKPEHRLGTARVPDTRVDFLSELYHPKKTTPAQVEYFLPAANGDAKGEAKDEAAWNLVRSCDELIVVVRNFNGNGHGAPAPAADLSKLEREMIFADFLVVEKRLARIAEDRKRCRQIDEEEYELLVAGQKILEGDAALSSRPDLASHPKLKGYSFLSAKPHLVLCNNPDEDGAKPGADNWLAIKGKVESELAGMSEAERGEFMAEFGIEESAMSRVIQESYRRLGLASFFTVGEDEVKAWTIGRATPAVDAAEVIHSDIKKGFIRAEVVAYADLVKCGSHAEARKKGLVRLEGKTYPVQDGDIINFRFNV